MSEDWLRAASRALPARPGGPVGAERGPRLELPGRGPRQLRGRPQRGPAAAGRLPGDGAGGARVAGVPPPRRHLPGGRGGDPAVPRHRHRDADGGQHAQVAQGVDPSCRVVYVDNDPVVLAHARAGLRSSAEGATSYLDADAGTPSRHRRRAPTLDLDQPVGVIMIEILNFLEDAADVRRPDGRRGAGRQLPGRHAAGPGRAAGDGGPAGGTSWRRCRSSCATATSSPAGWPASTSSSRASSRCTSGGRARVTRTTRSGMPLLGAVARKP